MYREGADITALDWFWDKIQKAQEEAIEAALAVPINENSNSNNGPQDGIDWTDYNQLLTALPEFPGMEEVSIYDLPVPHLYAALPNYDRILFGSSPDLDDLDGHWRK